MDIEKKDKEKNERPLQLLKIKGRLPGLNEIVDANRRHRNLGAKQKRETDAYIAAAIKKQEIEPIASGDFVFNWYCNSKRRDKDNIAVAKKFIFDALQTAGIIENDGWRQVGNFEDNFYIDKEDERVEVIIKERKE